MKTIKNICFSLFVVCGLMLVLTNCFSPLGGQEEIGVTISLGQGRNTFSAATHERRVIDVTTPGGEQTIELSPGQHSVTISGRPGTWHIYVLYYDNALRLPTGGADISRDIQMGPPITIDIEKELKEFDEIPISNEEDLRRIAVVQHLPNVLNRNFVLTRNITLSSAPWTPIGSNPNFTGTFNGNGHTISGLTINSTEDAQGMFGVIGNGATVKNLGLVNVNTRGNTSVGGVVGRNIGTVDNCYVTGTVTGNGSNTGGVVGSNTTGTVQNSYFTGAVTGPDNVGGVVGSNGSTVANSYSTGTVTGTGNNVGGVVGINSGTVSNSYSTGTIISTVPSGESNVGGVVGQNNGTVDSSYSTGTVTGNQHVGGVVGINNSGSTVQNSYSTGTVRSNMYVGGVVGTNRGTVQYCYSTATVIGSVSVGGVVGTNRGTVKHSYATGNVEGSTTYTTRSDLGGVVGDNYGTVEYCYTTATVSGLTLIGGVAGGLMTSGTPTVRNNVALIPFINIFSSISTSIGRVSAQNAGILSNNYAREDMLFYGPPTATGSQTFPLHDEGSDKKDGANINANQYHTATWWTNPDNWLSIPGSTNRWDPDIWDIANGRLPILRNMPRGNQNPRVLP